MQLFRDVFNASPIGVAVEDLEGQPLFVESSLLLAARFQRRGNVFQTLCSILSS